MVQGAQHHHDFNYCNPHDLPSAVQHTRQKQHGSFMQRLIQVCTPAPTPPPQLGGAKRCCMQVPQADAIFLPSLC